MTKEEVVVEAARTLKEHCESVSDCDYCIFVLQNGKCRMQWITPQDWLIPSYKTENSPSDERKGEGWSTISVEENVGSNRELARPSLTINLVLKDDSSVPIVKEALSNFDDRRIDELINYIKALIMLTKE